MDEQQAIQRLKNGDISGLEYLVMQYQVKAVRAAFLITRDSGLAEDVVHDAFIHVYRAIGSFDVRRPFEPWFMRSVVNASVKMVQRSARQVEVWDDADEAILVELARRVKSVESQVESIEVQDQIWAALQRLSPRQRAVIVQNNVNFVLPCLVPQFPGPLLRDWQFSLHLIPWDGTPLAPLYTVPTEIIAQSTQTVTEYGITFALEQVIDLGSGYVFEGSATWTDANIQPYSISPYSAHLTDSTGRMIPL